MRTIIVAAFLLATVIPATAATDVRVSAAASLRDVVTALAQEYTAAHPGTHVLTNFGGSGTLAVQAEKGAPADIFISANREWVDYLTKKGRVDAGTAFIFARTRLVFVGRKGAARTMTDLPKLTRIAIGSPRSVPAGEYAMQAMTGAGIAGAVDGKLVFARDVRDALMYAERGEVDGAFVYYSDAVASRRTALLFTVPQELYPRVEYVAVLTTSGAPSAAVRGFSAFLASGRARDVLAGRGFGGGR